MGCKLEPIDDGLDNLPLKAKNTDRSLGKAKQAAIFMTVINNASIKPIVNHLLDQSGGNNNSSLKTKNKLTVDSS
ncbi:hypothetical protein [Anabaena sp. PCC 7108]|uniref:hypothetical protein n=1 Tax=Anabaena sp. PCC 7108 TaxID=163908 RepID=UPI00034D0DAC|nr:hypothetical protein [Anabaena sp. PCC 7108]